MAAATNPAVAAQLSVGVHRNTVTKTHKAIMVANPSAKHARYSDRNFTVSIQSIPTKSLLFRTNSIRKRSDTRIMTANPQVVSSSSDLTGVQFFTECQFGNLSDQNLTLEDFVDWHGYGDTPKTISANQLAIEFKHFGDAKGSVGAVSYLVGDNIRWVIAWSNSGEDELKLNKVYSEIHEVTERGVDWGLIKEALDQNVSEYKTANLGYSASLIIDPTTTTPTMTATLN